MRTKHTQHGSGSSLLLIWLVALTLVMISMSVERETPEEEAARVTSIAAMPIAFDAEQVKQILDSFPVDQDARAAGISSEARGNIDPTSLYATWMFEGQGDSTGLRLFVKLGSGGTAVRTLMAHDEIVAKGSALWALDDGIIRYTDVDDEAPAGLFPRLGDPVLKTRPAFAIIPGSITMGDGGASAQATRVAVGDGFEKNPTEFFSYLIFGFVFLLLTMMLIVMCWRYIGTGSPLRARSAISIK